MQYKKLDKVFDSNKKEEKIKGSRANSNQVYSKYLSFYKYHDIIDFARRSFIPN